MIPIRLIPLKEDQKYEKNKIQDLLNYLFKSYN